MRARVLITGGAGYLGPVIAERLLGAGYSVTVVDNLMYGQQTLGHLCHHAGFDFVLGDVRDHALMARLAERADAVLPLAALVGAPACERDPWTARAVNQEAVEQLCRSLPPGRLILLPPTNSGYGTRSGAEYCTEETPLEPISLYGRTKAAAEAAVLGRPNGISLRLATVFGMAPRTRLDLLVNNFVYQAVTEGALVLFEKEFRRNFVHVRDVADCMLFCLEHSADMAGRAFNLGLDEANLSKEALALKGKSHLPGRYIHHAEHGSDPDRRDYIVSNRRLREAGFAARRSLDEGIVELIKGLRMLPRPAGRNVSMLRNEYLGRPEPAGGPRGGEDRWANSPA